jgi:hypothetical protein
VNCLEAKTHQMCWKPFSFLYPQKNLAFKLLKYFPSPLLPPPFFVNLPLYFPPSSSFIPFIPFAPSYPLPSSLILFPQPYLLFTKDGILKMLALIFNKEANIKDALVEAFRRLYTNVPANTKHANYLIAKNLIRFVFFFISYFLTFLFCCILLLFNLYFIYLFYLKNFIKKNNPIIPLLHLVRY